MCVCISFFVASTTFVVIVVVYATFPLRIMLTVFVVYRNICNCKIKLTKAIWPAVTTATNKTNNGYNGTQKLSIAQMKNCCRDSKRWKKRILTAWKSHKQCISILVTVCQINDEFSFLYCQSDLCRKKQRSSVYLRFFIRTPSNLWAWTLRKSV